MRSFGKIIISIVAIAVVAGLLIYLARVPKKEGGLVPSQPVPSRVLPVPEASDWTPYTNTRLGFSMNIPKLVEVINGQSPIVVLDDGVSSRVYVRPRYQDGARTKENTYTAIDTDQYQRTHWGIEFATAKNDTELTAFINQGFYNQQQCEIAAKEPSGEPGVFDVKLKESDREDTCFIDELYFIKYNPEKHRAALWGIGQDYNFVLTVSPVPNDYKVFDFEMAKSFRFE